MKSILVVQLKRLGDLILTTPALAALREKHPGCQVTVLIDHYSRDLAPALQHIDEVLVYERKHSFRIWLQLLRREFDLCIDCTGSDRSALISFFIESISSHYFSFGCAASASLLGLHRVGRCLGAQFSYYRSLPELSSTGNGCA